MGTCLKQMEAEQLYLEIIPSEEAENDHSKLMKAYERLSKKIDTLIEKRRSAPEKS